MKLCVIREDGRPVTFWEALARNLLRIFDAFPGFVIPIYSVGLITIFASRRDQRASDFFAGTVVVRERGAEAPTFEEVFSNPLSDAAFRHVQKRTEFQADVSLLTENEIAVVETFLCRRRDLSDNQRIWMAWRIALPLMYKMKPEYDLQTFTYEGFLEEVIFRFHSNHRFTN
ncbi:MAG: RDD family protein [Pyrinomonadaceae bacterium]